MKKISEIGIVLFLLLFITACTPKEYYLKPELYGQLVDNITKMPIANKEGYI